MEDWSEQFDKIFNHDSPDGKAIVIIEDNDSGGVSQRPAQKEIKQFIKQTITEVLDEAIGEEYPEWGVVERYKDGYDLKRQNIIDIKNKLII